MQQALYQTSGGGMKILRQDRSEFNVLFVHSELDDYGLDAQEFRIYAHLARRANGKNKAYPGINSMSEACRMNRHTVLRVIKSLEEYGLIKIIKKSGSLNEYLLTTPSEWKRAEATDVLPGTGAPNDTGVISSTGAQNRTREKISTSASFSPRIKNGTGAVSNGAPPPVLKEALKGNPEEGNPSKDNTVGGSVTASHHAALSRNSSAQTPLQRKAYAIAARLEALHWDNCKIRYSLHPARAYAERALVEGHHENRIVAAYTAALRYCHGVATDEINRGQRSAHEKATCALTVTLAAEQLSGDDQTPGQRWAAVIERLQEECRRQQIEDTRIAEEIAQASPQIAAWFARQHAASEHRADSAAPRKSSLELEPTS